jgi:hypothetical protein
MPDSCKIVVPDILYDQWVTKTNWSVFADRIIKKSDWDAQQTTEKYDSKRILYNKKRQSKVVQNIFGQ